MKNETKTFSHRDSSSNAGIRIGDDHYANRAVLLFRFTVWFITGLVGAYCFAILPPPVLAAEPTVLTRTGQDTTFYFGQNGYTYVQQRGAINMIPDNTGEVCSIELDINWIGTPTDGVKLTVYNYGLGDDTGANPANGSLVTSSTLTATEIASTTERFNFQNCFEVIPGNRYHLLLERTGSNSDANYYSITGAGDSAKHTSGFTAGSWTLPSGSYRYYQIWRGYYTYQTGNLFGTSTVNFNDENNCRSNLTFGSFFSSSTLEAFGCILFMPAPSSIAWINEKISNFNSVFPFNLFFDTLNLLKTDTNGYTTTNANINLPLGYPGGIMGSTTVAITSSTISGFVGQNVWQIYWSFLTNLIWLMTAGFIIFTIIR
jgi:hypothetical protein